MSGSAKGELRDNPRDLVVGVGTCRGVTAGEVLDLILTTLTEHGLSPSCVARLATVEARAEEEGLIETARILGVPLVAHPAQALARVAVPNPSPTSLAALGTPGVCEAAALIGNDGELLVPKRVSAPASGPSRATAAVARVRAPEDGHGDRPGGGHGDA